MNDYRFDMLETMDFRAVDYGEEVARLLALDGAKEGPGRRAMSLAGSDEACAQARDEIQRQRAQDLFPGAKSPQGAMSGLYLYFSCLDEAHTVAQDLETPEGSFWHGIMHRREPDAQNAAYWFRHAGKHPIFPALRDEARRLRFDTGSEWDPFEFIEFCDSSRQRPGSEEEAIAKQVQLAEWQLLFAHCARGNAR
jgi:hypothetical protein